MFNILILATAFAFAIPVLIILYVLSLRRIVPTNEVHIVQRTKDTVSYGKDAGNDMGNTYYEIPSWIPHFGVVVSKLPTIVLDIDLNDYEAYDKDRLPFVVDIKAFFRISDFNTAASRVFTIEELKEQLTSIVQGAARSILAKEYLEDIMSKRNEYGEQFTREVASQLTEWGVQAVKNIELMDIRDSRGSEVIANIMKKKKAVIEMESRKTVAENLQKAKEAEIIAQQQIELSQQDAQRKVGLREAEVQQEVGIAQEKQKQEVQEQAKLTAEKEMQVKQVRDVQTAEIEKAAATVRAEQDKSIIEVNAQAIVTKAKAEKDVQILQAEADKQQTSLKAEADLIIATNQAKGVEATGKANAEAEKLMRVAEVEGQIRLADKIGENEKYQQFVIKQKQVEAMCEVGKEQAKNLANADIKIFANGNSVIDGVNNAGKLFTPQKGLDIASMLEGLSATDIGKQLTDKFLNTSKTKSHKQNKSEDVE